jgi:hypothetical protein
VLQKRRLLQAPRPLLRRKKRLLAVSGKNGQPWEKKLERNWEQDTRGG